MAAWFPSLHPEEPFFSAVARYAEAMVFPDDHVLTQSLFGTHAKYPVAEFPGHLNAFVANLPPGHPHTAEGLLLQHTPFPYTAPFYPRRRVADAADEMRWQGLHSPRHRLFVNGHDGLCATLRYCPECVAADQASADRIPRWRRVHQLTGVLVCPEHRVPLWKSSVEREWRNAEQSGVLPSLCSLAKGLEYGSQRIELEEAVLQLALKVADDSLWLLRHPQLGDSLATVMERHRSLLAAAHWMDARGRPRHDDLQCLLSAQWAGVFPYEGRWTRRMWRSDEDPVIPLFHILQWRALGLSAEEFFSGHPPEVVRRTPRVSVRSGPCLNPGCKCANAPMEPRSAVVPEILLVACSECRYVYAERTDGLHSHRKVLRFGQDWRVRFRELAAAGADLPAIARALGASERRVMLEALQRRVWPTAWPREVRRELEAAGRAARRRHRKCRTMYRNAWSQAISQNLGLQWAVATERRAFRWLLRFDAEYLGRNLGRAPCFPSAAELALRPAPCAGDDEDNGPDLDIWPVSQAAAFLRSWHGFPIPVTIATLRILIVDAWRGKWCNAVRIREEDFIPHVDTPRSFALRRIVWAALGYLIQREAADTREIAKCAGLSAAEVEAFAPHLEFAANSIRGVATGESNTPAAWVPRCEILNRHLFEEQFQILLDNPAFLRKLAGRSEGQGEEAEMARCGGPSNIERRRREGFGEGEGADYKPWETPRSAPSRGKTHRVFGHKCSRMHILLSDRELWCWYLLEWSDAVRDVREQYPLHNLTETQEIAASLGYAHPKRSRTAKGLTVKEDKVLTVDFLVTLAEPIGGVRYIALSVKTEDELRDPQEQMRVFEKEEIARRYWERRGVPFRFVTEAQLPRVLVENLSLVYHYRDLAGHGIPEAQVSALLAHLYDRFDDAGGVAVHRVCSLMDGKLGLPAGSAVRLVWHAIATRAWSVDMTVRLGPDRPLRDLGVGIRARMIA